jgi:hypothetical protein
MMGRPGTRGRPLLPASLLVAALGACGGTPEEPRAARWAREIQGVWVSAALERASNPRGEVSWRRRVFEIGAREFRLAIDVFGDEGATDRRLTLEFVGPWRLGPPSVRVPDAMEADFGHTAWSLTVRSPALLAHVAAAGCTDTPWALDVPQDVSARGCLGIASVSDCPSEYDIVSLREDRLVFGERVVTPCRPELRLATLSPTDAFVRSEQTYSEVVASWNPPR